MRFSGLGKQTSIPWESLHYTAQGLICGVPFAARSYSTKCVRHEGSRKGSPVGADEAGVFPGDIVAIRLIHCLCVDPRQSRHVLFPNTDRRIPLFGRVGAEAEAVTDRVWATCCAAPTNTSVALWHDVVLCSQYRARWKIESL